MIRKPKYFMSYAVFLPGKNKQFQGDQLLKEIKEGINIEFDESKDEELQKVTSLLKEKINAKSILLTLSGKGICINSENGFVHTPAYGGSVIDVSGAGDTVIAVLSMALVANGNFEESAQLANLAAGIVVGKVGTATVTTEEIFSLL